MVKVLLKKQRILDAVLSEHAASKGVCRQMVEDKMREAFIEMFGAPCLWKSTPRRVPTGARSESVPINTHEPT
jgi:hypothetical protein